MTTNIIIRPAIATVVLLLIPLLARWPWTMSDFIVMGTMIFVTGLMLEAVMRKGGKYRVAMAVAIVILFLWLWVELAVGLFTNWGS